MNLKNHDFSLVTDLIYTFILEIRDLFVNNTDDTGSMFLLFCPDTGSPRIQDYRLLTPVYMSSPSMTSTRTFWSNDTPLGSTPVHVRYTYDKDTVFVPVVLSPPVFPCPTMTTKLNEAENDYLPQLKSLRLCRTPVSKRLPSRYTISRVLCLSANF